MELFEICPGFAEEAWRRGRGRQLAVLTSGRSLLKHPLIGTDFPLNRVCSATVGYVDGLSCTTALRDRLLFRIYQDLNVIHKL